jgi:hypothetical protein
MKINFGLIFFIVALITVIATGMALFISFRTSGISLDPGTRAPKFEAIETGYDPNLDANTGFVIQPYQTGNSDQNPAVLIGAAVSYILREVKAITMFTVILAAFALTAYVIIVYIVLNKITRPIVDAAEPLKDISEAEVGASVKIDERGGHIEEQTSGKAYLSMCIDEMLANIYSVTGNPEIAGDNELAFPSDAECESLQNMEDDIREIA